MLRLSHSLARSAEGIPVNAGVSTMAAMSHIRNVHTYQQARVWIAALHEETSVEGSILCPQFG